MKRQLLLIALVSCGSGDVNSNQAAQTAYDGLDESVDKAITLGFAGFNAASSANIPTETANGDIAGTISVNGQVDQGTSANRVMNLNETLTHYADVDGGTAQGIYYDTTDAGPAALSMKLSGVPTGTLSGSLTGTYSMTGSLTGDVALNVTFNGQLEPGPDGGGVERKPGTVQITGTATSGSGTYTINVTH